MTYLQGEQYSYKLEVAAVGHGSYGQVRKATCLETQDIYACKTVMATKKHVLEAKRVSSSLAAPIL